MVSRPLTRPRALLGLVALCLALAASPRTQAVPVHDPGPFVSLLVGHVGASYRDALPRGPEYRLVSGQLAPGLSLSIDGRVSGTPSAAGRFAATLRAENGSVSYPVRLELTVYRADEADLARSAPSFLQPGSYQVDSSSLDLDLTNPFDGRQLRTKVQVARPRNLGRPAPLLLFHRGRGFDEDDYLAFHRHIASHGIAVASVEDRYSFAGASFSATNSFYDWNRAELGMLSASAVVEAAADLLLAASDDAQDPLYRAFDAENLFMAGHSRGGGAAHASHHRSLELRLKGLIYLMAFDLRYFREVRPPASSPAYDIPTAQPRTPSLLIVAENDGDLTYPICDQFIDRATGPATQVTVYGGVHNLISDSHSAEGNARISRAEEQTRVADWIVCFIKRWSGSDTGLDWRLYGGAHQGSDTVGVTSWRASDRTTLLEDAQDGDLDRNLLGPTYQSNLRRREQDTYPATADLPSLGLKHVVLTPTDQTAVWRMVTDQPTDLSRHTRLVMRLSQTGTRGWSDVGVWVRLLDGAGGASWYRVWEPGKGGLLPRYGGLTPLDRFVDVHVDLRAFFASGSTPAVDLTQARALDLFLVDQGNFKGKSVIVDAVRFE
ncbi:MAG: hypothetical protein AB7N76_12050 [Planctomycetota bacterium]